jgi:hypothetical protein
MDYELPNIKYTYTDGVNINYILNINYRSCNFKWDSKSLSHEQSSYVELKLEELKNILLQAADINSR